MELFDKLGISSAGHPTIDWELTPADTFGTFESWGGRERVRHASERFYYFFINGWQNPPGLCLMERGIKFARVLAEIDAPRELLDQCMARQGKSSYTDKNFAIDPALKDWLQANLLDHFDAAKVHPVKSGLEEESQEAGLPRAGDALPPVKPITLRGTPAVVATAELQDILSRHNFFDSQRMPQGGHFVNALVDNNDDLTVTDRVTGLMWQRGGIDIMSLRAMQKQIAAANADGLAGYGDWRLPTMEEALSLMEPRPNSKGLFLHPCFSRAQAFIFTSDQRKPGGYWFGDFKQGTVFWASGTIPGGFGRLVRMA